MRIALFGKNIFRMYQHHIMEIRYESLCKYKSFGHFVLHEVDTNNLYEEMSLVGSTISLRNLERIVRNNRTLVKGFLFKNSAGCKAGTIWVMFRGGNDIEYKIRNIDAYIFNVYVSQTYRGNGFAGEMIYQLMNLLHNNGVEKAYLAVSLKNMSAIRAYEKIGFVNVFDRKFVRVLKINIPYHIL